MGLLDGRVSMITGASRGVGRVMSRLFAREGAKVVCVARSRDLVEETASMIRHDGFEAIAVAADASDENGVKGAVEKTLSAFGLLDCLVNNAGDGGPAKPVQDYLMDDWQYTLNSCLTSSYVCARFCVPAMIRAGRGAIVNISSMAGRRGLAHRIGYCSAKAGQIGMTYGLAVELGRHNITVNAVVPASIAGERNDAVIADMAKARGISKEALRKLVTDRFPLQRMTAPEDVAWAALFLCSDHARNISGQCIPVTAGEIA